MCVILKWRVYFFAWNVCLVYLQVSCRVCVSLKWSASCVFERSVNEFYVKSMLL